MVEEHEHEVLGGAGEGLVGDVRAHGMRGEPIGAQPAFRLGRMARQDPLEGETDEPRFVTARVLGQLGGEDP